jgi:hypothetical protein
MDDVGIFYSHLVYFVAILSIFLKFDVFSPFWYVVSRKIWQPWTGDKKSIVVQRVTSELTVCSFIDSWLSQSLFFRTVQAFLGRGVNLIKGIFSTHGDQCSRYSFFKYFRYQISCSTIGLEA